MDWITDQVAIGDHAEARDADLLRRQGVRSVLSLDGSLAPADAERLGVAAVLAFDLIDGAGNVTGRWGGWSRLWSAWCGTTRRSWSTATPAGVARWSRWRRSWPARCALGPADAVARVAARRVVCITPEFEELLYERDLCD